MALGKTLITVKEAANILGLPESTVYNRKGGTAKLTRVKHGKAVRMIRQEIESHADKLINAGRREIGTV
jgi:predicted DNA-binding transcriptional regulator AlpA